MSAETYEVTVTKGKKLLTVRVKNSRLPRGVMVGKFRGDPWRAVGWLGGVLAIVDVEDSA